MSTITFDREKMARWYANEHYKTDTGVEEIYFLPSGASEREIRFLEVNQLLGEMQVERLTAVDYGVDAGTENEHKLLVVDVTPKQLAWVNDDRILLPEGWTLDGAIRLSRKKS